MSSLRVRFRFNHQTGGVSRQAGGTKGIENFSRVIVQDVAFSYSEGLYEKLKSDIAGRMHNDIDKELNHIARLFMSGIVGIAGRNLGGTGSLTTVAPLSDAMKGTSQMEGVPVRTLTGTWAKRSPGYMASQGKRGGAWFRRHYPSPLDRLRSAGAWTGAYGGISISVKRHTNFTARDPAARGYEARLGGTRGGNARVGVANIRVEAMRNITTSMLPALGGGGLGDFGGSPRSSGLLSMLGSDIANRLGGNPARVPFRPTIQPFLGYFLTRQLPNAVFKRIEQGLNGSRLTDGVGSRGRSLGNSRTQDLRAKGVLPSF